ncbi:MAG: TetR/AcrR family transcriptional regulator [Myxococcota bacterium]
MAPSRREQQRLETRQRLFNAAIEIFRRDGVADSSIEDIVRSVGVSRGTFYFHFPTKEAVLEQLLIESEAEFAAAVQAVPADATIEVVLEATAEAMALRWSPDPALWTEVALVALRSTADQLKRGETVGVRERLGERFRTAATRGEVSTLVDAQSLADFYLASAFAVAISWSTIQPMPLHVALKGAAFLFLNGVKSPS